MRTDSLAQYSIFDYIGNEDIGDLKRLNFCLNQMNYKPLIEKLDNERANGRNEYPNLVMFFIFVSMFLFQRLQFQQIRRELSGNPSLRTLVGLNDADLKSRNMPLIPSEDVFTNFLNKLILHYNDLLNIFNELRNKLFDTLDIFGIDGAGDGKYFDSYAPNKRTKDAKDRRGESSTTYSQKVYTYSTENGEKKSKKETHYGFRKHTIVDSYTELPIVSRVYPANVDERNVILELINDLPAKFKDRMRHLSLDRGYDSTSLIEVLKDCGIKPIIDKRMMKKTNKLERYRNNDFYYNDSADVYCLDNTIEDTSIDPNTHYPRNMVRTTYKGYDKQRECLRYHYKEHSVRIYIQDNPRIFTPVARDSKKFKREYNKRTSVERYHSRLDQGFGFENHTIRGLDKMRTMLLLSDIIMLSNALAHIELGQTNYASIFGFGLM